MATETAELPKAGSGQGEDKSPDRKPFGGYTGGKKGARKPSQLLKDMRKVYKDGPDQEGGTASEKICRQLLKDSPERFLMRLEAMEKERKRLSVAADASGNVPVAEATPKLAEDAGAERMGELTRRLLEEFKNART
jgi:hypothetical protein